jgi:hypothetical protein
MHGLHKSDHDSHVDLCNAMLASNLHQTHACTATHLSTHWIRSRYIFYTHKHHHQYMRYKRIKGASICLQISLECKLKLRDRDWDDSCDKDRGIISGHMQMMLSPSLRISLPKRPFFSCFSFFCCLLIWSDLVQYASSLTFQSLLLRWMHNETKLVRKHGCIDAWEKDGSWPAQWDQNW